MRQERAVHVPTAGSAGTGGELKMDNSWTNQKQRIDCKAEWDGKPNGKTFYCNLCGHKFIVGDKWRWVYQPKHSNFFVCETCDIGDVRQRWQDLYAVYKKLKHNLKL
jgi:predicted RNA-binding Zn-ribbon protein involved in translation (DUF1610 family)